MARLGRKQADKLHACGVRTLAQLADLASNPTTTTGMGSLVQVAREAGIDTDVVLRHARQAKLQQMSRDLPVPTWLVRIHYQPHRELSLSVAKNGWIWLKLHHTAYSSRDFIDGDSSQAALSRALPPPSYGDIFFDLEGHPFAESESGGGGIESREYLWGASTVLSPSGK